MKKIIDKIRYFKNIFWLYLLRYRRYRFKRKYPTVKLRENVLGVYSQMGQDVLIYNTFFKNVTNGVYCDIGGNHPIDKSNTYLFEKMGWKGLCFEPLPEMKPLWEKHRNTKFFPYAVSNENKQVEFSVVKDIRAGRGDELSHVTGASKHCLDLRDYEISTINVQAVRLSDILESQNITHISYMSIDVEGHEMQVLEGIDFKERFSKCTHNGKLNISVLSIENDKTLMGCHKIRDFMEQRGYIFYMRISNAEDIYVHKDFVY